MNDNRVYPPFITSEDDPLAMLFHNHENTACMDQVKNIRSPILPRCPTLTKWPQTLQSIICKPAHNERVRLQPGGTYKVEGFAYNGSGSSINRIELTLDGGKTWRYCFKHYVDKPLRYA